MTQLTQSLLENVYIGEHWVDDHGTVIEASGEAGYNHEGYVLSCLIPILADAIGFPDHGDYESDYTWFKEDLLEWLDGTGRDADAAIEKGWESIVRTHGQAFASDMRETLNGRRDDARAFAIKHWGWIRIAGTRRPELEMRDFTPRMLKRGGEAVADLLFEMGYEDAYPAELQLDISIYGKPKRLTVSLQDLLEGRVGPAQDAGQDALQSNARVAVDRMDQAIRHPHYSHSGD